MSRVLVVYLDWGLDFLGIWVWVVCNCKFRKKLNSRHGFDYKYKKIYHSYFKFFLNIKLTFLKFAFDC